MSALRTAHRGWLLAALAVFVLLAGTAGRRWAAQRAAPTPTPQVDISEPIVWASGKVVPAERATLSFGMAGQLIGYTVKEGDEVAPGDVIAFLNAPDLENAFTNARAALRLAEAEYADALTAAEETAAGTAARAAAAQGDLAAAAAVRDKLITGPGPHDLEKARIAVDEAKDMLYGYQAQRDSTGGALQRKEVKEADYDQAQARVQAAEDAVRLAETELARLQAGPRIEDRAAADAQVQSARSRLRDAQVSADAAAARLRRLQAASAADFGADHPAAAVADIALGDADGPTSGDPIGVAAARRDQARASLESARTALTQTELKSPFAATIGSLLVQPGERVMPGQSVAILGNLDALRVETTDLRETDVARVAVGQPVEITFDSLPEIRLPGKVAYLAPMAMSSQGGTSFMAWVTFDRLDPRVRWGMTAYTNIRVEPAK